MMLSVPGYWAAPRSFCAATAGERFFSFYDKLLDSLRHARMAKLQRLTSAANPLVKDVRKAVERGELTSDGCCIAETNHLLAEALRSACEIECVLAAESVYPQVEKLLIQRPALRLFVLPDQLLERL